MKIKWIDKVDSTNTYLKEHPSELPAGTMLAARTQNAGRGQRGNSWEAEPGKNLTFSFRAENLPLRPSEQFAVSEATALAIVALLRDYGIETKVKWPNDIYVGNRKICGILIENSIMGDRISSSVIGAGLNVNQTIFTSDAPNPVSMLNIALKSMRYPAEFTEFSLREVAEKLGALLDAYMARLGEPQGLHSEYIASLWRGDGTLHPFRDTATGERFDASIKGVELTGHLLLDAPDGIRRYAFKEVAFL